jgi:hypothetical protein
VAGDYDLREMSSSLAPSPLAFTIPATIALIFGPAMVLILQNPS